MRFIPTAKQLTEKVKLVEVKVEGEYIARIDEKRKTSKAYSVTVTVREKFNKGDLKRATPKVLAQKFVGEFISMRTFDQVGAPKKTEKTCKVADLYSKRDLERFARIRQQIDQNANKKKKSIIREGGISVEDTSEIDPVTGLPYVVNDGPEPTEE